MRPCPLLDRESITTQSVSAHLQQQRSPITTSSVIALLLYYFLKSLTWFWFCSRALAAPWWERPADVGAPHLCRGPVWWRDAPGGGSQMDGLQNPLSDTLEIRKIEEFLNTCIHYLSFFLKPEWIKLEEKLCDHLNIMESCFWSGSVLTDTNTQQDALKSGVTNSLSEYHMVTITMAPESKQAPPWHSSEPYLCSAVFANRWCHCVILAPWLRFSII